MSARTFVVSDGYRLWFIQADARRDVVAMVRKYDRAWRRKGWTVRFQRRHAGSFIRSREGRRKLAFWVRAEQREQNPEKRR